MASSDPVLAAIVSNQDLYEERIEMGISATSKFLASGALAAMAIVATPLPASAHGSPPPKVKISALSKPTIGAGGEKVYTFDVTAKDPDGIITGVDIEVVGPSYHTGRSVMATCAPGAVPGRRFTFQVSEPLPSGGVYRVRAKASSVSSCDDFGGMQSSRLTTRRFVVRS